jgi:hypothetical protein
LAGTLPQERSAAMDGSGSLASLPAPFVQRWRGEVAGAHGQAQLTVDALVAGLNGGHRPGWVGKGIKHLFADRSEPFPRCHPETRIEGRRE